jgi:hypothetical protein
MKMEYNFSKLWCVEIAGLEEKYIVLNVHIGK